MNNENAPAPVPAQEPVPIAAASADIFDLIREWAYLPEGQRGYVERKIIGCLNRSFHAGMIDGKALGALSVPVQAQEPVAYRWPDGPGKFYYQDVADPVGDCARMTAELLYRAPVQPVPVPAPAAQGDAEKLLATFIDNVEQTFHSSVYFKEQPLCDGKGWEEAFNIDKWLASVRAAIAAKAAS